MTSFNRRVFEMLLRVLAFAASHSQLLPKDSTVGQLFHQIEEGVEAWSEHQKSQLSAKEDAKTTTAKRSAARAALKEELDAVSRTAKALNFGEFWMMRDRSDRSLLQMGEIFAKRAEPLRQSFIDNHLPADFIERLNSAVQDLQQTITAQTSMENARVTSTSAVEETRNEVLAAVERLDPVRRISCVRTLRL